MTSDDEQLCYADWPLGIFLLVIARGLVATEHSIVTLHAGS